MKIKREELNQKIELSILQQMLYLEKSSSLPNSRFKRIRNLKNYSLVLTTIVGFFVGLSFTYLFYQELFKNLTFYKSISKEIKITIELSSLIILSIGALFILKSFIKSLYHFKFQKINLKGEVELNREVDNNSILNKNLDEIIYFFEKTNYNVVVIEDLDRFKEPEIFTKLREINLLLNNSKQVNRHITFIYALKDEMFKDGNRTKFFDFIVPVIPIINPSNSYDLLCEKLKHENINDQLLDDISLYIDDMRLLKNIVNEFKIYKEKLTIIDLDKSKLLSFIIYKNKYPEDFAKLHYNEGIIYEVFNTDEHLIKQNIISQYQNEIEQIKLKKVEIENFQIENIDNLRKLYILKIIENFPKDQKVTTINLDRNYHYNDINNLLSDVVFEELIKTRMVNYTHVLYNSYHARWDNQRQNISFDEIEEQIGNDYSYIERESIIKNKSDETFEKLKQDILQKDYNIKKTNELTLGELISESTVGLNISIAKEDILIYFLRNGLIDKNYWNYISLFHETENGLSKNDQNFILGIRNKKPRELNYKLNNIDRILKKVSNDFDKEIILNLDLLDYLFTNKINDQITDLFSLFHIKSERKLNFINLYIHQGKYLDKFIKKICIAWIEFWDYLDVDKESKYAIDLKDKILMIILLNVESKVIIKQNTNGNLSKYISNKNTFLNFIGSDSAGVEKIIKNLILLKIKFIQPLEIEKKENLFNYIYENNLYKLNEIMIEFILKVKGNGGKNEIDVLKFANYTTIQNSKCDYLKTYIESEINNYISNVFLQIEENTEEVEENVIKLLNHKILNNDLKIKIAHKENVKINNVLEVIDTLWEDLIAIDKFVSNWDNLINYFSKFKFDDNLISFLNNLENSKILSESKIADTKFEETVNHTFIRALLLNNKIDDESYSLLLKSVSNSYKDLDLFEIDDTKIHMLITAKIIVLDKENFELVKENSEGKQILLVELNFSEYLKTEIKLEINEYISILNSPKLTSNNKIDLILKLEAEQIRANKVLSNIVTGILSNNKKIEIDYPFLSSLIDKSTFIKNNILLFNIYFDLFKNDITKLENILSKLGNPYSEILNKWTEFKIEKNAINTEFIDNLKSVYYHNISSDKHDDKDIKIVTKRK
ncbi:hypothetical protein ACM55G_01070 [Flavobacterium sp. LB3P122]|uniref:YobI family P-loop NTPase n=1 Tax=Flavobacterium algoriphilum TaxID=3398738 RepID=UPI003A8AA0FD